MTYYTQISDQFYYYGPINTYTIAVFWDHTTKQTVVRYFSIDWQKWAKCKIVSTDDFYSRTGQHVPACILKQLYRLDDANYMMYCVDDTFI